MPIYEYECGKCQKVHEIAQKITAKPLKKCPECGSADIKKLISRSSFALKGSGYYTTDYKRAGQGEKKAPPPAEKTAEPAADKKAEKTLDKTGDKKAEKKTDNKNGASGAPSGGGKPAGQT